MQARIDDRKKPVERMKRKRTYPDADYNERLRCFIAFDVVCPPFKVFFVCHGSIHDGFCYH